MSDTPNVFISWSGPRSKSAALALRKRLRSFINAAVPWMSDKDIRSGTVSLNEIFRALQNAKAGIICLTEENVREPWPSFEAGALWKALPEEGRVCTYLLPGMEQKNVAGPLASFQFNRADKAGTLKLLTDLNAHLGNTVPPENLESVFEKMWPELETELQHLPESTESTPPPLTPEQAAVQSLEILRSLAGPIQDIAAETAVARDKRLAENAYFNSLPNTISFANTLAQPISGNIIGKYLGPLEPMIPKTTLAERIMEANTTNALKATTHANPEPRSRMAKAFKKARGNKGPNG